ncbi:S1C family serine protease [Lysinibacillus sp. RSDA_15]|uniref:S1C family serine protease n=1 Tax=Lysinibacillus TaxID=400634 RepID=UPI00056B0857|nr:MULTISPECIES: trypsin-like peptidase domain-containing protein [Lysinibacillus]MBG9689753.1 2-alkenal reductase [Lysinibacillus sphaericus]MBI6864751.1 trypsin-like peptidase domain-containing protein [Lysinibacillus fusiformis]MDM5353239.1 trypsin-like peptidase domain-containing protein [Lysinibacillus sphaericus]QTB22564.1 trypsin-like peptidase domain-containing protein [Lysinibacillus sphaericus]QTB27110.1 trypsin-like peptidase domain-containing protein [Lysinibacillus sphaericus]
MSYFQDDDKNSDFLKNEEIPKSPLQERLEREEQEMQAKRHKKKGGGGGKGGYFFSGLVGVIIGALLVWLMMPGLVNQMPGTTSSNTGKNDTTINQVATEVTTDVTKAVDKASPAVVGITNIQEVTSGGFWSPQSTTTKEAGSGSGVVYKIEGNKAFIVTNNHVIEGAKQLEVTMPDGTKEQAELVGHDVWTDLAVISISSKNVKTVATFGNSDVLKQGETVIAIGNPLGLDFYGSVTTGVVSGKDRSVPVDLNGDGTEDWQQEVLQTDAAINPGNSGGALVNLAGELIGINSMKIAQSSVEGLGFSIPINSAIPIIEELEKNGEMKRPTMGISLADLTDVPAFYQQQTLKLPAEVTTGVVITDVMNNSAASKAGVQQYDVIVEMDGQKIETAIDLRKHLYNEKKIGDQLTLKVYRQGKLVELSLTLTNGNSL